MKNNSKFINNREVNLKSKSNTKRPIIKNKVVNRTNNYQQDP
jgi:hypothetical protein